MREFTDERGDRWEVFVGHQSWGTFVLLFAARARPETRSLVLAADSARAAERELDALSDEELRARLADAAPWG